MGSRLVCQTPVLGKTVYLKKRQKWVEILGPWAQGAGSSRNGFPYTQAVLGPILLGVPILAQNLRVRGFEKW